MFSTSSSGSTWISRMRMTASEFCSALHKNRRFRARHSVDRFVGPYAAWFGSGVAPQPRMGLLPLRDGRYRFNHTHHPDAAWEVLNGQSRKCPWPSSPSDAGGVSDRAVGLFVYLRHCVSRRILQHFLVWRCVLNDARRRTWLLG